MQGLGIDSDPVAGDVQEIGIDRGQLLLQSEQRLTQAGPGMGGELARPQQLAALLSFDGDAGLDAQNGQQRLGAFAGDDDLGPVRGGETKATEQ